ncbi:catalase family protein [Coleofasciculus sp. FACHB-T130]|uniref:catalase family protein n=1 Tax=Cyanophyceae TaxID=3028117 RepID=UPI001685C5F5|nr:catalase family protein [Coleofasciculus sp. FACHB-T130]MBD1879549.1 catalase family protein [Coleofasciculus sp. FACHB-T130]
MKLAGNFADTLQGKAIDEIVRISKERLREQPLVPRGQHAKHHGCVRGEFTVEANLPEEMRFGVFKEPGKRFTACIRFSNASGDIEQPDTKDDARGMAIKVFVSDEEQEKTQDFVTINHPVFFIRNAIDFAEFFKAVEQSQGKPPLKFFFPGFNPFKWRLHEFMTARAIQSHKVVSPLEIEYWSTTPYKLGSQAIKFAVKPSSKNQLGRSASKSPNYLREAMVEHLKMQKKQASFDFLVQFQTDAERMPIEDPTIEWKSPFHKVATIEIPDQSFDSDEQMRFCEHLSYTPWHSLPEHKPLGGINRARQKVYEAISELRHERNEVPKKEPTEEEFSDLFPE